MFLILTSTTEQSSFPPGSSPDYNSDRATSTTEVCDLVACRPGPRLPHGQQHPLLVDISAGTGTRFFYMTGRVSLPWCMHIRTVITNPYSRWTAVPQAGRCTLWTLKGTKEATFMPPSHGWSTHPLLMPVGYSCVPTYPPSPRLWWQVGRTSCSSTVRGPQMFGLVELYFLAVLHWHDAL